MANVKMSEYLSRNKVQLKKLVEELSNHYEYVSILGTDVVGKRYGVQRTGINIDDSDWSERGFVIRVFNGTNYSELSFNEMPEDLEVIVRKVNNIAQEDVKVFKDNSIEICKLPLIEEEGLLRLSLSIKASTAS